MVPGELKQLGDELRGGRRAVEVSVRELLSWFDAETRDYEVVRRVRDAMAELDVVSKPDFETAYLDSKVALELASRQRVEVEGGWDDGTASPAVPRLGTLEAANRLPNSITRDEPITRAITSLVLCEANYLVVMQSPRSVDGVVSWESVGRARTLKKEVEYVRDCMAHDVVIMSFETPLLEAVKRIEEKGFVLVSGKDRSITGLVTARDISGQFRKLSEPFLLIGQIEGHIRALLSGRFTLQELRELRTHDESTPSVERLEDLTIGEYIMLIERPEFWVRLDIELERTTLVSRLHQVREIRNKVMHFHPDGLAQQDVEILRKTVSLLEQLNEAKAD